MIVKEKTPLEEVAEELYANRQDGGISAEQVTAMLKKYGYNAGDPNVRKALANVYRDLQR